MQVPPIPIDERYRLDALRSLKLLDTLEEPQFDSLVRLGKRVFGVETCLISLVDAERQWFKARIGLDAKETPRDVSFCGHAIIGDEPFIIRDALQDDRFHDNPLVVGPPHIRFYAGVPLRIPTGYKLGTYCIISPKPRPDFDAADEAQLADLARLTVTAIAMRTLRKDFDRLREEFEQYATLAQISSAPLAMISANGTVESCNDAFKVFCNVDSAEGVKVGELLYIDGDWASAIAQAGELKVSPHWNPTASAKLYPYNAGFVLAG